MGGIVKQVEKTVQDAGKAAEKTANDVGQTAEKAAQDTGKAAEKTVQDAGQTAEKAAQDAGNAAEKAGQDIVQTAEKAAHDVSATAEKAAQDTGHTIEKGLQDGGKTLEQAWNDVTKTGEKAANDTVAEVGRAYDNTVELAAASYHFIENQARGIGRLLSDAEKRALEGKLVDAVWHVMVDQHRITEENAAKAVMESSLLNNISAAGAAAYGGPGGAAAYAAWYTYHATDGNLQASIKAGAIAWATCQGLEYAKAIEGAGGSAAAKRVLASAAVGGAAVAASGGTDEQVLAAFGRGALLATVRESYKASTGKTMNGKGPTEKAVAKGSAEIKQLYKTILDKDGKPTDQIDTTSMPQEISHVGMQTSEVQTDYLGTAETNGIMQDLAGLPYMNDMAYFHDHWMEVAQIDSQSTVQATILPAIVFVGAGTEPVVTGPPTEIVVKDANADKNN